MAFRLFKPKPDPTCSRERLQSLLDDVTDEGAGALLSHLLECRRCAGVLLGLMDESVDRLPDPPGGLDSVPPS